MKSNCNIFVVADPNKCIGCRSCELACAANHREDKSGFTIGTLDAPVVPRLFIATEEKMVMPVQCKHCEESPCVNSCPVKAIEKDENGVRIDEKLCIGCKTCSLVCPVGAINLLPKYNHESVKVQFEEKNKLTAHKCDLCLESGLEPACVRACPKDALKVVVQDANGDIFDLKEGA